MYVYKFVGFGLLSFLALLVIPVSSATQSDDSTTYGMATVSLKDESGNILIENQIHNEVVDQGSSFMLEQSFNGGGFLAGDRVNGICVSDASSFSTSDSETPVTFNGDNTIGNPYLNCHRISSWQSTATSVTTSSSFVAGTAFADNTTITGIGICGVASVGGPSFLDCTDSGEDETIVLFSVIKITDTLVGPGSQIDITYTFNLD
jgi:hypothetical protein